MQVQRKKSRRIASPHASGWRNCPAVERKRGKVSGTYVFTGTRVPVSALFENLRDGASVEDFLKWFPGVKREQVEQVLEHEAASLTRSFAR